MTYEMNEGERRATQTEGPRREKKKAQRADKMAHWTKELSAKSDHPSSVPGPHTGRRGKLNGASCPPAYVIRSLKKKHGNPRSEKKHLGKKNVREKDNAQDSREKTQRKGEKRRRGCRQKEGMKIERLKCPGLGASPGRCGRHSRTLSGRFVTQARIRWTEHSQGVKLSYRYQGQVGNWQTEGRGPLSRGL